MLKICNAYDDDVEPGRTKLLEPPSDKSKQDRKKKHNPCQTNPLRCEKKQQELEKEQQKEKKRREKEVKKEEKRRMAELEKEIQKKEMEHAKGKKKREQHDEYARNDVDTFD